MFWKSSQGRRFEIEKLEIENMEIEKVHKEDAEDVLNGNPGLKSDSWSICYCQPENHIFHLLLT